MLSVNCSVFDKLPTSIISPTQNIANIGQYYKINMSICQIVLFNLTLILLMLWGILIIAYILKIFYQFLTILIMKLQIFSVTKAISRYSYKNNSRNLSVQEQNPKNSKKSFDLTTILTHIHNSNTPSSTPCKLAF